MKQLRTRMILFVAKENTLKRIFKIWFLLALLGLHCVPVSAALAELYWPVRYENGTSNTSIGTNNGENGHRGIDISNASGCSWYAPIDGVIERIYTGCVSNGYNTNGHISCNPKMNGSSNGRSHLSININNVHYEGDYCNNGFGNGVVIQTNIGGRNYYFQFAHMDSVSSGLQPGQSISKGTYLGKVGDRGFSFGVHAHFEVNVDRLFGTVINNDPEQSGCQFTYNYNYTMGLNMGESFYAHVQNQSSGKYWTNIDNNVVGCDPTNDGRQVWHFVRQSDGSYYIQNGYNLAVMDVASMSGELGSNVYLNGVYTGNSNQRFFIYLEDGAYYFTPAYGGYHLDMSQNTYNLEIWGESFDGGPQAFSIYKFSPFDMGDIFYSNIVNKGTGLYLTNNSNDIVGRNKSNDGTQIWKFVHQSDGSYYIQNGYNLAVMDVASMSGELGSEVYLNGVYTGNTNQRFYIYKVGGSYYISPAYGGFHLDMNQSTHNLETWGDSFSGNGAQEFEINEVTHAVCYDSNGGIDGPENQTKHYREALTLSVDEPHRESYTFLGWATSPNATQPEYQPGDTYSEDEDITLYAVWEKFTPDFILPASLIIIEEEAFANCSFTYVQLPETTTTIRDYAFANCDNLRHIYIPEETTTISPNAFDNLPNTLTIHGRSGSYAESYAAENGFTFVAK